jgi:ABC-type proline/glycine betaine transport system permease subunit
LTVDGNGDQIFSFPLYGICPVMAKTFKGMQEGRPKLMEALIAELKQTK